jgi:hypothetical protein
MEDALPLVLSKSKSRAPKAAPEAAAAPSAAKPAKVSAKPHRAKSLTTGEAAKAGP